MVSEFLPTIMLSELKKLNSKQLRRLKCCEVIADGEYVFTFVNGMIEPSGFLRKQAEYSGQNANAVGGETLEQILNPEPEPEPEGIDTREAEPEEQGEGEQEQVPQEEEVKV